MELLKMKELSKTEMNDYQKLKDKYEPEILIP